jgi:hypothetical protein
MRQAPLTARHQAAVAALDAPHMHASQSLLRIQAAVAAGAATLNKRHASTCRLTSRQGNRCLQQACQDPAKHSRPATQAHTCSPSSATIFIHLGTVWLRAWMRLTSAAMCSPFSNTCGARR